MKLVNVADHFLSGRWTRYPAKDMPVIGADHHRAAVVQLHDMRQIQLAENMYHRNAGGSKLLLHFLNQFRFRQRLAAGLNVIETGMEPVVDIVLEGHDAACQPQDHQEDRRADAQPEVDFQNNGSHRHRSARPRSVITCAAQLTAGSGRSSSIVSLPSPFVSRVLSLAGAFLISLAEISPS